MAKFLEREKVIAVIEERALLRSHAHDMVSYKYLKLTKWDIADIPAADVRPVVRGKWRKADNPSFSPFDDSGAYIFFCSVCGKSRGHAYRFCPNCGADMRGGGGNE